MKAIFSTSIEQVDTYGGNPSYYQSQKVGSSLSTGFALQSISKNVFSLNTTSGTSFSRSISSLVPDLTKVAFVHVDIYDIDEFDYENNIHTFQLTINSVSYGQASNFHLLGLTSGLLHDIVISNATVVATRTANLVITVGLKP